jgi:hypothetical protein
MKMTIDELERVYRQCIKSGDIKEKAVDIELIRSMVFIAEKGLDFIRSRSSEISHDSTDWTFVFRDHYESLRGLIEAYLLLEGIVADSHQCKNAFLCSKHPELDLDWEFLEMIRLKRNAINYRGQLLKFEDWKFFKPRIDLHINALREAMRGRLSEPHG